MIDPKKIFDMVKNASEMQKNITEKLKSQKVYGQSGGGMVKVEMNGHFEVLQISIDDSVFSEDRTFLTDLVKAAINDATSQIRDLMADQIKSITGNLGF